MTPREQNQLMDATVRYGRVQTDTRSLPWAERNAAEREAAFEFGKTLKAVYGKDLSEAVHHVLIEDAYLEANDGFVTTSDAIERNYSSYASLVRAVLKVA